MPDTGKAHCRSALVRRTLRSAFIAVCAMVGFGDLAAAQTEPAFRFGEASLITPQAANNYYGSATVHTDGHGSGRSDELVSLAQGLDNDPSLIFEYVHDYIDYYPTFGLGKGALGAHLDKSGSALDQAQLLAELLDQARINGAAITSIAIKYGTLSLSDPLEISNWLGDLNAGELCRLLANGGIPGRVNGSTSCGSSGAVSTLEIAHAWVTATVNGSPVTYDPAYKTYTEIPALSVSGQDFKDAMGASCTNTHGITAGAPSQESTNGGAPFAKSFNYSNLATHLQSCASSLWSWIEANASGAAVEDILGGRRVDIDGVAPSTAVHNETNSWLVNGIPDQYRFKITIEVDRPEHPTLANPPIIDLSIGLYMDEVYGRRVALEPNGFGDTDTYPDITTLLGSSTACSDNDFLYALQLTVDGVRVPGKGFKGPCSPHIRGAYVTAHMDAPYAADSGGYQDKELFSADHTLVTRSIFALSAGNTGSDWARYYQKKLGLDRPSSVFWNGVLIGGSEPEPPSFVESGARVAEDVRYRLFAAWAEQFSRLITLAEGVGEAPLQHHYTMGWSFGLTRVEKKCEGTAPAESCLWSLGDDAVVMSLETAMSTPALNAEPMKRMTANAAAALESSVMEQQLNSTAPGGTAKKFRWGNEATHTFPTPPAGKPAISISAPHGADPQGAFPIYRFAAGSTLGTPVQSVLTSSGYNDCGDLYSGSDIYINDCQEQRLISGIQTYLDAGYDVVAVGDAYLGPGLRCGRHFFAETPNSWNFVGVGHWNCDSNAARGGAFIAYKPDFSEVAHVSFTSSRISKGGAAGGAIPEELQVMDIPTPADLLKEEEEESFAHTADLRSGSLSLSTGPLITAGTGPFPHSLPFSRSFQSGESAPNDPVWSHNWNMPLTISGSGNEMLGSSRALFASETLAMLSVIHGVYSDSGTSAHARIKQEVTGVLASAWWTDRMTHNVVSATVSGQATQFVRKLGTNEFYPAQGGAARVTQTGSRYQYYSYADETAPSGGQRRMTTLAWRNDLLGFTLTNPGKDVITYSFRRPYYMQVGDSPTGVTDKPSFWATNWSFPAGQTITFSYDWSTYGDCVTQLPGTVCEKPKLVKVENSIGRKLTFTGPMDSPTTVKDDTNRTVALTNTRVTHVDGKVTDYDIELVDFVTGIWGDSYTEKYLDAISDPGFNMANNVVSHQFTYDVAGKLRTYVNARFKQWTYFVGGGARGATRDPLGHDAVEYYDRDGNTTRSIDKVGNETRNEYDGLGRLIRRTFPEGNRYEVTYDKLSNVIQVDHCGKTDTACANPIPTTASYNNASWPTKPNKVWDANGNETSIAYWAPTAPNGAGEVKTVTQPKDDNNVNPIWNYAYDSMGRLTSVTNPEGDVSTAAYGAKGEFESLIVDPGDLAISTSMTHNTRGDPITLDGPRGEDYLFTYDTARRPLTTTDPMLSVTETFYNSRGWPTKTCTQIEDGSPSLACSASSPGNQSHWAVTYTIYSETGQPKQVRDPDGKWTSTFYDDLDRPLVTVDAMGRKTMTVYWPDGKVRKVIRAWDGAEDGTGATTDCSAMRTATAADPDNALQQCYQQYSYTANGQIAWVNDSNGQRTEYVYDDFDRLEKTIFPSKTRAAVPNVTLPDPADYEQYTYDDNGSMLTRRTRAGQTITYVYDDLNRLTSRVVPGPGNPQTYSFEYDLNGRRTRSSVDGFHQDYTYDAGDRLISQFYSQNTTTAGKEAKVFYRYDKGSNVTRITHPDSHWVQYKYDLLNRVTRVCENRDSSSCLATSAPTAELT
ncbi:MAG: hypothetical protein AAFX54_17955, partial [Pseudomonadota bacterium]